MYSTPHVNLSCNSHQRDNMSYHAITAGMIRSDLIKIIDFYTNSDKKSYVKIVVLDEIYKFVVLSSSFIVIKIFKMI